MTKPNIEVSRVSLHTAFLRCAGYSSASITPKFNIQDGDRIVWIGSTLVEREQRYGYWETALHAAFPDKQFTLRNLGWSGDTVFGEARAGFDNSAKGFDRLVSLTLELKPTVILVSYGANESFEGEAGLPKFEKGLAKLLDALKPAKARLTVLTSPLPYEIGREIPGLEKRNRELNLYSQAIGRVARERGLLFADLYEVGTTLYAGSNKGLNAANREEDSWYTDNGVHLRGSGYDRTSHLFRKALGLNDSHQTNAPEALREAIVEKNQLFFYKWRPQNETYLFGFRKHEQGKNAAEVAEFDPLVAKAEAKIEEIRKKLK